MIVLIAVVCTEGGALALVQGKNEVKQLMADVEKMDTSKDGKKSKEGSRRRREGPKAPREQAAREDWSQTVLEALDTYKELLYCNLTAEDGQQFDAKVADKVRERLEKKAKQLGLEQGVTQHIEAMCTAFQADDKQPTNKQRKSINQLLQLLPLQTPDMAGHLHLLRALGGLNTSVSDNELKTVEQTLDFLALSLVPFLSFLFITLEGHGQSAGRKQLYASHLAAMDAAEKLYRVYLETFASNHFSVIPEGVDSSVGGFHVRDRTYWMPYRLLSHRDTSDLLRCLLRPMDEFFRLLASGEHYAPHAQLRRGIATLAAFVIKQEEDKMDTKPDGKTSDPKQPPPIEIATVIQPAMPVVTYGVLTLFSPAVQQYILRGRVGDDVEPFGGAAAAFGGGAAAMPFRIVFAGYLAWLLAEKRFAVNDVRQQTRPYVDGDTWNRPPLLSPLDDGDTRPRPLLFASFLVFADTIERHFGATLVIQSAARDVRATASFQPSLARECKLPVMAGLISKTNLSIWKDLVRIARDALARAPAADPAGWVQAQLDLETIFWNRTVLQLVLFMPPQGVARTEVVKRVVERIRNLVGMSSHRAYSLLLCSFR